MEGNERRSHRPSWARACANSQGLRGLRVEGLRMGVWMHFATVGASAPLNACTRRRIRNLR
eukprot:12497374-Alexandrium_andersonii.AAC.1